MSLRLRWLVLSLWLGGVVSLAGAGTNLALTPVSLKDYDLVDQEGHRVFLVSEVMGNHAVVMNFLYTDCTTACPVSTTIMKAVYERLRSQEGVRLITITVNPAVDTPARLRQFAGKYGATGSQWVWLTGDRDQIDELLSSVHAYSAEVNEHPSLILIGDPKRQRWTPLYGFPSVSTVLDQIHRLQR